MYIIFNKTQKDRQESELLPAKLLAIKPHPAPEHLRNKVFTRGGGGERACHLSVCHAWLVVVDVIGANYVLWTGSSGGAVY